MALGGFSPEEKGLERSFLHAFEVSFQRLGLLHGQTGKREIVAFLR